MTKNILSYIGLILIGVVIGGVIGRYGFSPPSEDISRAGSASLSSTPYRSGPFKFGVVISPEKPVVGDNKLTIILRTLADDPVSGARISAVAEMPAMGAMPAMRAPAEMREVRPGVYEGSFEPSMEGAWPLTIEIEKPELGSARVSFDMATDRTGLRLTSGATDVRDGAGTAASGQVQEETPPPGTITVDSRRRQLIGLEIGEAVVRPLTRTIRAYGRVTFDERRVSDISLKYDAWIGELEADFLGAPVRKGDVLFTIFSPDLYAAQQEYLDVVRRSGPTASSTLRDAAAQRLRFWGMTDDHITDLAKAGRPQDYVPILAPRDGIVVDKNVVEGTGVKAGATLLRIADLSEVWVEAEVYEADIPLLSEGMEATIALPYLPSELLRGRVEYIYPYLEDKTRTGRLRLSFPNPDGLLKPQMYTEAKLKAALGEALTVPEQAVIVSGETRVVFEDLGNGRLAPRRVSTGRRVDGYVEILDGLEPGNRIVTSGNFLIASESRLKAGLEQWQ